ncbi:MAG TPA: hypothetical protein VK604_02230, partial [Bryobacteraceae bacterium]|nr:hypothetical protein [Bryobacteraceae bacterium]
PGAGMILDRLPSMKISDLNLKSPSQRSQYPYFQQTPASTRRVLDSNVVEAVLAQEPPTHLLLGTNAYERAMQKIADIRGEFESWHTLTVSTDFK